LGTSAYRKGYIVELRCKELLKDFGATHVIRSSRSLTPADLVAIFGDRREIWLVQVKAGREAPEDVSKLRKEFEDLARLKGTFEVKTFVFMKKKGKYTFIEV